MTRPRVLVALTLLALLAACALASVHARRIGHDTPLEKPRPFHPTAEDKARFDLVRAALESRNYSRPAPLSSSGAFGIDVPVYVSPDTFACLKNNGYSFAIVRAWHSYCAFDTNGPVTVANAWQGGMAHADIYLFPSFTCSLTAAQQVDQTLSGMGSVPFGTLWFDIEQNPGAGWGPDPDANHAWLVEGVNEAVRQIGADRVGIYSSAWGWVPMGNYGDLSAYPLWWARYDNDPSFDDFTPFANWQQPAMKQYNDTTTVCGLYTDVDWYPM